MSHNLPSRNQIGDFVNVHLGEWVLRGQVDAVKFTESKVFYDITITQGPEPTPIYDVDSAFVSNDKPGETA